jgi:hypothetical protein
MVGSEGQAGHFASPLKKEEVYVDGDRGVYAPNGMPGELIVLIGEIIAEECDVSRYHSHTIAREILTALGARVVP